MFPENHAVLVVGEPNAGMFEFCSYLGSTYLTNGESLVFVETNTSPVNIRKQMALFGVNAAEYEASGMFVIVDCYTPPKSSMVDPVVLRASSSSALSEVAEKINEGINKVGGPPVRVLIDSLTPLFMEHEAKEVAMFFKTVSSLIKESGAMTCVLHRGLLDEDQISVLSSLADGLLEIRMDEEFRRFVRIKFVRGLQVTPRWVPFDFEMEQEAREEGAMLSWKRE
ncbi:MAG: hypothetical protein A3K67_01625 [Euryarchaeota archaeon RBG_16_62_10]|nr:MAG: hypothetical protein A3K67_01625 [Euryarchaeota archaeon RBG_16_62_10]